MVSCLFVTEVSCLFVTDVSCLFITDVSCSFITEVSCSFITDVSCGLSMLITCLLVNLPTRQLPLIIIDVNYGLSLQVTRLSSTCLLVNCQQSTTNYANDTNYITINISVIREIRSR